MLPPMTSAYTPPQEGGFVPTYIVYISFLCSYLLADLCRLAASGQELVTHRS